MATTVSMPLFPLGLVLYPGVMLPLHIFEDRYRLLVKELLELPDGARRFGVVAIKAGREVGTDGITALHTVGCTAELRYAEAYQDGRFDIISTGMDRFRLVGVQHTEPLRGDVELLPEVASAPAQPLADRVRRLFTSYRQALIQAQGAADDDDEGIPALPGDPTELSYLVAAAMILDLTEKQQLLDAATVDDRLRMELTLLKREASMVGALSLRPAVELPRTPYASN
ncbi:LON peptidase substrate-binding domain-containing protein [Nakamurella sp. GG22]